MLRRTRMLIEGVSAYRAADKLVKGGIAVLSVQESPKKGVFIEVASKDLKKAFAILRSSCYNVKKVRLIGLSRAWKVSLSRIGLLVGAAVFLIAVSAVQNRVLRIDVTGTGAYYENEVKDILIKGGVSVYGRAPKDTAGFEAEILSLPGVSFCSLACSGGVLTVEVQVNAEDRVLTFEPLLAPCTGKIEEITVMRGTACVTIGDEVSAGDVLADCSAEGRAVIVVARAVISFPVREEIAAEQEESALAEAEIRYGKLQNVCVQSVQNGWIVEGTARVTAERNMI